MSESGNRRGWGGGFPGRGRKNYRWRGNRAKKTSSENEHSGTS